MSRPGGVRRFFRLGVGKRWAEETVDLEIRHHLEMRVDELVEEGHRPDEARRIAEEAFGDMGAYRRECITEQRRGARMTWWTEVTSGAWQDIRYALRGVRKAPGFALAVVLTLGIGIGANTAIFTIVNATILRPLEFEDPDELHLVQTIYPEQSYVFSFMNAEGAEAWTRPGAPFEHSALNARARVTVRAGGPPESASVQGLSAGVLDLLRVLPEQGRPFTEGDTELGAEPVAIVSEEYWSRALGRTPDVLGSTLWIDGREHRVVGVMPHGFRFPTFVMTDLWLPMLEDWTIAGQAAEQIQVTVRVPPEAVPAKEEAARAYAEAIQETGLSGPGWHADLEPLNIPSVQGSVQRALWITFGAVGLMLLIALVNGINLMLARGTTRSREIGVRLALGGSRLRVATQLFVESLLLALAAGVAAAVFAWFGVEALLSIAPREFTFFVSRPIEIDSRVLAFTGGLSVVIGLLFGMAPALYGVRRREATSSASLAGSVSGSRAYHRFRGALVAVQLALSLVVLFGAGLLGRSFYKLVSVDPGFDPENLAVLAIGLSPGRYDSPEARAAFGDEITARIAALPSVTAATRSVGVPPGSGITFGEGLWIEGRPDPVMAGNVYLPFVDGRYDFAQALGVELLAGRYHTERDDPAARLALVDEDLAQRLGGVREALGQRFALDPEGTYYEVIGVTKDLKVMGPDDRYGDLAMVLNGSGIRSYFTVAFRTDGPVEPVLPTVRQIVRQIDVDQPIEALRGIEAEFAESVARPRFFLVLMGVFAGLALTLAGVGLYSVLSFAVTQRTREMGIRVALGAGVGRVRAQVLGGGLRIAALGVTLGALGSLSAARVLEAMLFQTSARDSATLALVALAMMAIAALASWVPARRATRVDPVQALRAE